MSQIICVTSLKGGVGKTTTAVNLSTALALAEKRVLLVDCDPQGNATAGMGIDKATLSANLYHCLTGKVGPEKTIVDGRLKGLKMFPSRIELLLAETELSGRKNKEKILRHHLNPLKDAYDYMIIDTPPSLGLLTINAMTAADALIIPLQCEFYAMEGLTNQLRAVRILQKHFNPRVRIMGILLTMFEPGEETCRRIADASRKHFSSLILRTVIPRDAELRESAGHGKPLLLKNIMAPGARRYLDLAREVMTVSHRPLQRVSIRKEEVC